jgi:hypothetical protein
MKVIIHFMFEASNVLMKYAQRINCILFCFQTWYIWYTVIYKKSLHNVTGAFLILFQVRFTTGLFDKFKFDT